MQQQQVQTACNLLQWPADTTSDTKHFDDKASKCSYVNEQSLCVQLQACWHACTLGKINQAVAMPLQGANVRFRTNAVQSADCGTLARLIVVVPIYYMHSSSILIHYMQLIAGKIDI